MITIKNRIVYGDHYNLGKAFPLLVSIDNEHNKGLIVEVFRNPDVAGIVNYQYEDEFNCCLVSIYENGQMTLRQIGDRLGISFARVKQIETEALKKIKKNPLINE